jgi:hypothetical protein
MFLMSLLTLAYLFIGKPFSSRLYTAIYGVNEICIMSCTYILFLFTDFSSSSEVRYNLGWAMLANAMLMILLNSIFAVYMILCYIKIIFFKIRYLILRVLLHCGIRRRKHIQIVEETESILKHISDEIEVSNNEVELNISKEKSPKLSENQLRRLTNLTP